MDKAKAVSMRVELSDGEVLTAEGDHTAEVWAYLQSCEVMSAIHGGGYRGKPMNSTKPTGEQG